MHRAVLPVLRLDHRSRLVHAVSLDCRCQAVGLAVANGCFAWLVLSIDAKADYE